jgi:predicted TIM-barrel fold metal-dependent hydrolase
MNHVAKKSQKTAKEYLKGIKVVDTDTHITEWPDLWTSRATPKFKNRVPRIEVRDGKRMWMIDDHELFGDSGFSAIKKDGSKLPGLEFFGLKFDDVHPGSHNVKARLAYMDDQGIAAQVGYTNLLGFGGPRGFSKVDPELKLVSTQIMNDALAEMQTESKNRIYPMAMMPWWDLKATVAEAQRCAKMGLRGINMNAFPEDHALPDLGDTYWSPLWEVCESLALPVHFHIGFSDGTAGWQPAGHWKCHDPLSQYVAHTVMMFNGNMKALVNLLLSPIFERHPKLKFVSVESAVGWVPFMLEMLDYQLTDSGFGVKLKESKFETFKRHFYICGWFERLGMVDAVRRLGPDVVMFETDFPHPTCLYPGALEYLEPTLAELSHEENLKVFQTNAEKLYKMDLSAA